MLGLKLNHVSKRGHRCVKYYQTTNISCMESQNLKHFLFCFAVVFGQSIEARCWVKNKTVVGAVLTDTAQSTSEWLKFLFYWGAAYIRSLTVTILWLHSLYIITKVWIPTMSPGCFAEQTYSIVCFSNQFKTSNQKGTLLHAIHSDQRNGIFKRTKKNICMFANSMLLCVWTKSHLDTCTVLDLQHSRCI